MDTRYEHNSGPAAMDSMEQRRRSSDHCSSSGSLSMDEFRLLKNIGNARGCTVHAAEWTPVGAAPRSVALKMYNKKHMSESRRATVWREARMMQAMHHLQIPHVVQFYGIFEDAEQVVIVMELCENGDVLEALLHKGTAMSERQACRRIILPVLAALVAMHANHIAHRDIKLENLFLTKDSRVLVGDFGLTISLKEDVSASQIGTVEYMSPEIVQLPTPDDYKHGRVNPAEVASTGLAVDIWALGVTMYEVVSGACPYASRDKEVIKQDILNNKIAALPDAITDPCKNFIMEMLTYDRKRRPTATMLLNHPFMRYHCSQQEIMQSAGSCAHLLGPLKQQPFVKTFAPLRPIAPAARGPFDQASGSALVGRHTQEMTVSSGASEKIQSYRGEEVTRALILESQRAASNALGAADMFIASRKTMSLISNSCDSIVTNM